MTVLLIQSIFIIVAEIYPVLVAVQSQRVQETVQKNQFNYSPLISWRKPCRGAIPQLPEARCFEEGHHNKISGQ